MPSVAGPLAVAGLVQQVFSESQRSVASYRGLASSLYNVLQQCVCYSREKEVQFVGEFLSCLNSVLPVKKSEPTGDRVIKFCTQFVEYIQSKELDEDQMDVDGPGAASATERLINALIQHLIKGCQAKNKVIRLRSCQLIAATINLLREIDDKIFQELQSQLEKRIRDREHSVRIQAVIALSRFQTDEESGPRITKEFRELLQHDPNAEVRRAVLMNLEPNRLNMPYILERTRDIDAMNRRCVFGRCIHELGDFRTLTIGNREKILRWGLTDRDETVRKYAGKMFAIDWVTQADGNIINVLDRLDVVNSKIAPEALLAFFKWNPEALNTFEFNEAYWDTLTAETALLVRCFNDYCNCTSNEIYVEHSLPEVSKLCVTLRRILDTLFSANDENTCQELEFIAEQLLLIIKSMDFADETGRRLLFSLIRNSLSSPNLPDALISSMVSLLRRICTSERDFCQLILEIISDLHDTIRAHDDESSNADESFQSATSTVSKRSRSRSSSIRSDDEFTETSKESKQETVVQQMIIKLKSLHIAQSMLENVFESFQTNSQLRNCLTGLVIPSIRSRESPIREKGLLCLGLCCLLESELAKENAPLFAHCLRNGHESLKVISLQILTDIIVVNSHQKDVIGLTDDMISSLFIDAIQLEAEPSVQASAAECVAKLMLTSNLYGAKLLRTLLVAYFDPSYATNYEFRQILSYFIPVYSHSMAENQTCVQSVAIQILRDVVLLYDEMDEEETRVSPSLVAAQLLDWTDPRKLIQNDATSGKPDALINHDVQTRLCLEVLERLRKTISKEEKKALASTLNKLYISSNADADLLADLRASASDLLEVKSLSEGVIRNAIVKFHSSIALLQEKGALSKGVKVEREAI